MSMRKIFHVARREYLETVRTKTFLIGLAIAPIMVAVIIYFSGKSANVVDAPRRPQTIDIVDRSGLLKKELRTVIDAYNKGNPDRILLVSLPAAGDDAETVIERRKGKVRRGILDGAAVLSADALTEGGSLTIYTRTLKASDLLWPDTIRNLVNRAVFNVRCEQQNVSPELVTRLRRRVAVSQVPLGADRDEARKRNERDRVTTLMLPFAFMFLMYMGVVATGQHMLTSIIEEKSSRIVEVLLAALTPLELMVGKILGLAAVGLTIITVWMVAGVGAAQWRVVLLDVEPGIAAYFLIYYVLGFLLYSSILAALGSVCNALKEAQSLMMPVMLMMIIPMVSWMQLSQDPSGTLARTLSFVPPTTSMVMILRIASGARVAPLEILASILWLAASVVLVMWAGARIFRTGVLLYGKRPGLRELLRWVAQK